MLTKEEVLEKIKNKESFKWSKIGYVDFLNYTFEEYVDFSNAPFERDAIFQNAVFKGKVNFSGVEFQVTVNFIETEFHDEIKFNRANIEARINFDGANFQGRVNFFETKFQNWIDFSWANFNDAVNFIGTEFNCGVNFGETKFLSQVNFNGAIFQGKTFFNGSVFKAQTDFINTKFEKEVDFQNTHFDGLTQFIGRRGSKKAKEVSEGEGKMIVEKNLLFSKDFIIDFRDVTFGQPEKVTFSTVNLSKCLFLNTNVSKIELPDIEWAKVKKRNIIYDEIYEEESEKNYALIEKTYAQLKKNFEENRSYAEAGDFHYGEMEMRRKRQKGIFKYVSIASFYKYLSGYGESYSRALIWLCLSILFFTSVYLFTGLKEQQVAGESVEYKISLSNTDLNTIVQSFPKSFVHTLQVAMLRTNLKYSSLDDWGVFVEILERIFIIIQVTLLILAVRRRFRR